MGTVTGTGVETRKRTPDGNGDRNGDGSENSSRDGNGDEDGNGNEDRIGEGRKRRRSERNRTRVIDAMTDKWETWWVERGNNVESKGLVM